MIVPMLVAACAAACTQVALHITRPVTGYFLMRRLDVWWSKRGGKKHD